MVNLRPLASDVTALQARAASGSSGVARKAQRILQDVRTRQLAAELGRSWK